jgi:pullulanase/glycogen debranching enzyme
LLLDPYAKAIAGPLRWSDSDAQFGYKLGHKQEDLSFDRRDSATSMPKCQVINPAFTWEYDRPPQIPWHDTLHHAGIEVALDVVYNHTAEGNQLSQTFSFFSPGAT